MIIYPAIDLLDNEAVQLAKGDYDRVSVYHKDPIVLAKSIEELGATHLHMIDLGGAKDGSPVHLDLLNQIREETNLFIQLGGGIRSPESLRKYIKAGIDRVILGTAAVEAPEFLRDSLKKYGDLIAVAIDAKDGKIAVKGWQENTEIDALDFAEDCVSWGTKTIIYTDIDKDGMLGGTNLEAYQELKNRLKGKAVHIIASGGIISTEEIVKLKKIGIGGAIIGKAMYENKLPLEKALEAGKNETKF